MIKRYLLLTIIVCLGLFYLNGQAIRHLESSLLSSSDSAKTGILIQLGYHYVNNQPERAVEFGKDALSNADKVGDKYGRSVALGLIGQSYYKLNDYKSAEKYFDDEGENLKPSGDPWMVNRFNLALALHYLGKERRAITAFESSLEEAKRSGNEEYLLKNYEALFKVNIDKNRHREALDYFKLYINERDEKFLEKNQAEINQMQNAYRTEIGELNDEKEAIQDTLELTQEQLTLLQLEQQIKDLEIRQQRLRQTRMIWVIVLLLIIAVILLVFYYQKRRSNIAISSEKKISDKLLHNILPAKVVAELKDSGSSLPENFSEVSVFFSDFAGFTEMSAKVEPNELIAELNELFTRFDEIMEKHSCERIKTIGDAYLAVCGLPVSNSDHAANILKASVEIVDWLNERNRAKSMIWNIRIGIHSGNVIGGIVGTKKYIYDVFGDTINTASRMESNSEIGRINVSEQTYNLLKEQFNFTKRPLKEVKGKGKMKMFFLESNN
jgi:adenylate cyclase